MLGHSYVLPYLGFNLVFFFLSDKGFLDRCGIIIKELAARPNDLSPGPPWQKGRSGFCRLFVHCGAFSAPAPPTHKKISKCENILNECAHGTKDSPPPASAPLASIPFFLAAGVGKCLKRMHWTPRSRRVEYHLSLDLLRWLSLTVMLLPENVTY